MSYMRLVSFSLPKEEADAIVPGSTAFNALVAGRKFVTQALNGLVSSHVWRSSGATGAVDFVISSEWNSLEDMQGYSNNPNIIKLEDTLSENNESFSISIYELLG
ncbi:MAG: hypothetical protein HXX08_08525 [Chloroflexi bacterium]|uniref:Uncharacterized protein n=1 Tax=Candidatus Chlorohelix allophototropha TaxID=3003348 RepID=A0A8T7M1E9_9CHLR|nr:hypothetical protein [Chloroflexota bacterium]WJW67770.1 hypothetical protein OZ401_001049 [Chloroflexota bacterium L227-S17]